MWWKCFPPEFLLIHMNLKIKVCMLAHSQAQNVLSERTPYFTGVIDRFFGSFLGPTCGAAQYLAGLQTPFSGRKNWNINKWLAKFIRSELLWIQWSFPRMLQTTETILPYRCFLSYSIHGNTDITIACIIAFPFLSFPFHNGRKDCIGLDCARSREALRLTSLDVDFGNDMAMAFLVLRLVLGLGWVHLDWGTENRFLDSNFHAGKLILALKNRNSWFPILGYWVVPSYVYEVIC